MVRLRVPGCCCCHPRGREEVLGEVGLAFVVFSCFSNQESRCGLAFGPSCVLGGVGVLGVVQVGGAMGFVRRS